MTASSRTDRSQRRTESGGETGSAAIALFTRNLRVHDNPVLDAAAVGGRGVVPLFVVDRGIAETGYLAPNRARFLADSLADLDDELRRRGAPLVVRRGEVVEQVCRLAAETGTSEVHLAADVSGYAQRRQRRLAEALGGQGRRLVVHESVITAAPPGAISPAHSGPADRDGHFAVFTPYYRRWLEHTPRRPLTPPRRIRSVPVSSDSLPSGEELCPHGAPSPQLLAGGERAGRARLDDWLTSMERYGSEADLLAVDATSRLSPYLHFGCVSPIDVLHRIGDSPAARAFARQLAWRDFHHQVLAARPDSAWRDYRPRGDAWRGDEDAFNAWREGRAGYPIVDAGMRQLSEEGWMHNRARLITASFLTKTLYIDWRRGAAHFLHLLLDGDIANNQLNWQWVAGTGTDTRPNRVLNPLLQARKFDPDGDYVRRWVPELAEVIGPAVHTPWKLPDGVRSGLDYPAPIVDLDEGRRRFQAARGR